jgi:molecular chaperone GrpE (heat shock protein)
MERMTFYVPPVFLFGNNANRVPHDEEKKSEYKTAAETEIKVENWRVKRIAELEEENKNLKEKIKRLEFDVDAWHQLKLLLE